MGRKPKTSDGAEQVTMECACCGKPIPLNELYGSNSYLFDRYGKAPYCKDCIDKIYQHYVEIYTSENNLNPEKKAIRRVCMVLDMFYSDDLYNSAVTKAERSASKSLVRTFLSLAQLAQYKRKSYDTTLFNEGGDNVVKTIEDIGDSRKVTQKTVKFFGTGFSDDDYEYLKEQYDDWTARHECNTKAQEEIFKQICFTQLELLKATRAKQDTKDLTFTFQKLLETGKLQPKQNSGETVADNQTFGTLIDKWENTRPLPDTDEELRDVDHIAEYIDVFFRGHLAKMMGIKNGFSNLYTKFMEKYTVNKPEYNSDENSSEVIFDAIFGGKDEE